MAALPQFDYLFAIGTIFSFLDAWNIGMLSLRIKLISRCCVYILSLLFAPRKLLTV